MKRKQTKTWSDEIQLKGAEINLSGIDTFETICLIHTGIISTCFYYESRLQ